MSQPIGDGPEKRAELRAKLMEHLEAAQALADETRDGVVGYLVESAFDQRRANVARNVDLPPQTKPG